MKKTFLSALITFIVCCTSIIAFSNYLVEKSSNEKIYERIESVPTQKIGLVLGCSRTLKDGSKNRYFFNRIKAAYKLWSAGKIEYLLVSGDNSHHAYDEPTDMKNELLSMGVPDDRIVCDFAGFRTLDSVVRTSEVFNESTFIVISQRFHAERAIYIAEQKGLSALGFCAEEVHFPNSFKTKMREYLARVNMILDLHVFYTEPRYYGPKLSIPAADTLKAGSLGDDAPIVKPL